MNALCYVGIPQKWESPKGVMMRTAYHNGYSTVAAMCAALDVPLIGDALDLLTEQSSLLSKLTLAAPNLAQLLLVNSYTVDNTDTALWIIDEITLHRTQFARHFMYCPECLRNKLITVFQDIRDLRVCPIHRTRIITHCPVCHVREHWATANLFFCKCGSDRRNTKCESGTPFEEERLEIFGPDADIRDLSYMTYIVQTCEDIWTSRKSNEDKNLSFLEDSIRQHAIKMIRAQLEKYPGFTRLMHLSPWSSSHPLLVAISNEFCKEPDTFSEKCRNGLCCADLELTLSQIIHPLQNRKQISKEETFITSNFKINRHGKSMPYYQCNIPICNLVRTTNELPPQPAINNNHFKEQPKEKTTEQSNLQSNLQSNELLKEPPKDSIDLIYLSTRNAALLLHCSRRTVLELAKLRHLNRSTTKLGKKRAMHVSKNSIDNFNKVYILVREISQQLNTTPIHIIRALNRLGFETDHDEPAPYFFKQSDIYSIWDELINEIKSPSRHFPKVCRSRPIVNSLITSPINKTLT
jgi:hypothetical protein